MSSDASGYADIEHDNSRLINLSDGVFAFAMTLLVVDLSVPDSTTVARLGLAHAVANLSPKFVIWVISFAVIGNYWRVHHRTFDHLQGHDSVILWLNLLFLLCVSFIPFPTVLLGAYSEQRFAVELYAVTMVVTTLVWLALWLYSGRDRRFCAADLPPGTIEAGVVRGLITTGVFALSIPIAFINVDVAEYSWLLIAVVSHLAPHPPRRARRYNE